jgi:hypothetical protein
MSIGIRKPFVKANERLKSQRSYANIVFAEKESAPQTEPTPVERLPVRYAVQTLLMGGIAAALAVVLAGETSNDPDDAIPFAIGAFGLTVI